MAGRLFAFLMRLFPRGFRAEYGDTVLETLARRAQDARRRGAWARMRFVVRESVGLVHGAAAEHAAARGLAARAGIGGAALRSPFRQLRRHPLYAAACVGTLALAVAAAAASIAVLRSAFLRPLPYADDHALASLFTATETWPDAPVSAHVLEDLRAADAPFDGFAPMDPGGAAYSDGTSTQSLMAIAVTPEFFEALGVRPAQGRVWLDGELDAAVVSWSFWQTSLAGDPAVIGRRITIDGANRTVVGVMAQEFVAPFWPQASLLLPLDLPALVASTDRAVRPLSLIVRRAEGQSTERVNAFLAAFSTRLRQAHPRAHDEQSWHVVPLREFLVGDARPALLGAGAAAALLLVIVGANVAGLSAARAIGERHQTAVQLALGAARPQLMTQRALDAIVLSGIGAAVGVWLAYGLVAILTTSQPDFLARLPAVTMDAGAALTAAALGLTFGLAAAVVPYGVSLAGPPASLAGTRGATGGIGVTRMRSALVVLQVATALVLVVGAGLLVRTLRHLSETSLGFEPGGLVAMSVGMPGERYPDRDAQVGFERSVLERLAHVGGVTDATASIGVPVIGGGRADLRAFGRTDEAARGEVAYLSLAPDFMEKTGMRLLEGRGLEPTDASGGPGVVVINEAAARRFWPEGGAIGSRIRLGPDTDANEWITIVGIVADIRQHGPTEAVLPTAFGSTWQYSAPQRWFTVRAPTPPTDLYDRLRVAVHEVDTGATISRVASIDELISERTARQRLVLMALGFYGLVAVVLSASGVYAVVSLASRQRRREYAIRMAVGAQRHAVRWLVMRQALVLAGLGVATGVVIAVAGTRVLRGLLHGVAPVDLATFVLTTVGVLGLAVVSAWVPAWRAGRVEAGEVLKG